MRKIIVLILGVTLVLGFAAGCQPETKTKKEVFDARFQELEAEYSEFIDSIKFPAEKELSSGNLPQYSNYPELYDELSTVGLRGITVLIDKTLDYDESVWPEDKDGNMTNALLSLARSLAVSGILRIDEYTYYAPKDIYLDADNRHLILYNFIKCATQELSEAFESEIAYEDKMSVYRKYGLMSVPFVKKEIEKGNGEFEKYFILVGAHIDTAEFFKYTESTIVIKENGKKGLHIPSLEEEVAALEGRKNAATFDYKVWLAENEEDLNFLYTYLEYYLEEYESNGK